MFSNWLFFLGMTFFLFCFGTIIGSFMNVVIYRTLKKESWVKGRSKCENCQKQIRWYDNVPLLSYFLLGGKCRFCKTTISISHPVVEFLTASLFVWWYWGGSLFFRITEAPLQYIQPIFWLLVGLILLIIFFVDLVHFIIPDETLVVLTSLTVIYRLVLVSTKVMQPADLVNSLLGALALTLFFFSLWFFTKGKGMGFGDVKFVFPLGLLMGWPNMLVGIFLAFIFGSVVGVWLLVTGKKKIRQPIPFGPFLILGSIVALVFGNQLVQWYVHLL